MNAGTRRIQCGGVAPGRTPSPPSDGGEGRGEEERFLNAHLSMNPHSKAALKTTALQTLRVAGSRRRRAAAFGVRSLQHRCSYPGMVRLVQGFKARKSFRRILSPLVPRGEREKQRARFVS